MGHVSAVQLVSVNWDSGRRLDEQFSLLIVTEDGERHVLQPSPSVVGVLVEIARTSRTLFWDSQAGVLMSGAINVG